MHTLGGMKHALSRFRLPALTAAAAGVLLVSLTACGGNAEGETATASSVTQPGISVKDAWVRATKGTPDASMTGAFMAIDNNGAQDVTLTAAASAVAKRTELHEMAMVGGQMVMRPVQGGIPIGAGHGKVLMPGGYHVMLMGLTRELAPGDEVGLTLRFSDGTTKNLTLPVKAFTEGKPHYHAPGQGHPSGSMSPMDPMTRSAMPKP